MKNLKLTHIFILLFTFSSFLLSCGTEEDPADEVLELVISANSVSVGTPIHFKLTSSIAGEVTSQSVFYVNDEAIEGSVFVPNETQEENEVYATYNGKSTSVKTFSTFEEVPSVYTQKVLLEDYTGTWCGYCPRMASITHYLTEFSDRIVPVAIHCPGAPQDPWTYEFALDMVKPENYNAQGAPKGKINRIYDLDQMQGSHPCPNDPSVYYPQIDEYLNENAELGLAIDSNVSANQLSMRVKVGFATNNLPGARLVVLLVEDGLTYNQVNYYAGSGLNCDPEFNYSSMPSVIPNFPQEHVLLKAYTDIYGDVIPSSEVQDGNIWVRDFNVSLPDNVSNPQNLRIVAFVLGNGDKISNRSVVNVQSVKAGDNQAFD